MSANYTIKITYFPVPKQHLVGWCLDSPKDNITATSQELSKVGIIFRGWVLAKESVNFSLVFLYSNSIEKIELNIDRADVIRKILTNDPTGYEKIKCGFQKLIPLNCSAFSVGVLIDGNFFPLAKGKIEGMFKIIHGEGNWLFLDNDTNKSVEQYTGQVLLSWDEKRAWKSYVKDVLSLSESTATPTCLLIAPSKEMVYPEYYPFQQAKKTPASQLEKLIPDKFDLIFPINELRSSEYRSYRKSDTHWSMHGARIASLLLFTSLTGIETDKVKIFDDDKYSSKNNAGDLGSKLYPSLRTKEDFLTSFHYRSLIQFDNQLPNFGRVIIFHCPTPVINSSLLLFGSSSAYSMFHYLSRLFKNVIFLHTAGNIDPDVIDILKPDFICLQTNARFIVKAPVVGQSIQEYIQSKRALVNSEQLKPILKKNAIPPELSNIVKYFESM